MLDVDAKSKRRWPDDLQRFWRLNRYLCPIHGCGVRLAWDEIPGYYDTALNGDMHMMETHMVPLRCDRAGCVAKIKAWDWNVPGYEERPWCVEYLPEAKAASPK